MIVGELPILVVNVALPRISPFMGDDLPTVAANPRPGSYCVLTLLTLALRLVS